MFCKVHKRQKCSGKSLVLWNFRSISDYASDSGCGSNDAVFATKALQWSIWWRALAGR